MNVGNNDELGAKMKARISCNKLFKFDIKYEVWVWNVGVN